MSKYITFYMDSLCVLDELTNEQAGDLLTAIVDFNMGRPVQLTGLMKAVFAPFKQQYIREMQANDRETYVYFVKLHNENDKFIKIGTSCSLNKRYSDYKRFGYNVDEIHVEKFQTKNEAYYREKQLHIEYSSLRYTPIKTFGGYTECFSLEILKYINL